MTNVKATFRVPTVAEPTRETSRSRFRKSAARSNGTGADTLRGFTEELIGQLREQHRIRTSETYATTLHSFLRFLRAGDIPLERIDPEMIAAYEAGLKFSGVSKNTSSFYMRVLRAVYNRAVERGLTPQRMPFRHVYTGVDKTVKRAISLEEMRRIRTCDLSGNPPLEYARDNYCLLYLPQSLELLLGLPADCLEQEERERLAVRRQTFAADAPRNQLESALIAGDLQGARQLAERPDELTAMGYTEREIQRIAQAAESESSQSAAGLPADYAVGLRLYRFQRNLHGLAEGYMWQGLAQDRSIVATHLLLVLADEKRWQECCQLYEHFQSLYAENMLFPEEDE